MANTNIEWTQKAWNPIRGCSRVSEGCRNCYAERQAARFCGPGMPYEGLVRPGTKSNSIESAKRGPRRGPQWTGKVVCDAAKLEEPLHWKKPARIFVNSMSDLFHDDVPDEFIDQIFAVMALSPQHTFQILTKRPERMLEYFLPKQGSVALTQKRLFEIAQRVDELVPIRTRDSIAVKELLFNGGPLPNVWLGVSVEDQKAADERIPLLLKTPAAVRWISAEPLLGPINLDGGLPTDIHALGCGEPSCNCGATRLDWVVVGGESGPRARPCNVDWIRSLVQQCYAADVPAFVKQLGTLPFSNQKEPGWGELFEDAPHYKKSAGEWAPHCLSDRKGGTIEDFPADLRVRQYPEVKGV